MTILYTRDQVSDLARKPFVHPDKLGPAMMAARAYGMGRELDQLQQLQADQDEDLMLDSYERALQESERQVELWNQRNGRV